MEREVMSEEVKEIKAFDKLNDNQKAFVLNYIIYRVATKAYLEAYSNETNPLDYDTAKAAASRLLTDVNVSQAIKEKINEVWESKEKQIGKIFDEFISLGFSDLKNIIEYKDGNITVKDFEEIDTRAIKKIKIREEKSNNRNTGEVSTTSDVIEIELHDKKGSLAELASILNLKKQHIEIDQKSPITVEVVGE